MRTNRKTEEKKMSMSKNIARLALTAGLTAALSFGGVMAPVTMAFAEDTTATTNSITITQNKDNGATTFKAYQIFKADVVDPTEAGATDKIVSNVKWADGVGADAQKAIIEAINDSALKNDASPEDVANWLTENVHGTTKTTRVDKDSVLNKIAKVVKDKVKPTGNSFNAGTAFEPKNADDTPNTGYYLFLTDDASIGQLTENKKNTGTSPIFAVVGGNPVVVTEKTSIPTVDKQVLEGDAWGKVSDSYIGEEVEYKLTGSVADNIATFNKYQYEFHDTLSKGLEAAEGSGNTPKDLHVYIDNNGSQTEIVQDNNGGYKVVLERDSTTKKENLTITFTDLKTVKDKTGNAIKVDADSKVVVTYKATLTSDAEYTATGNTNDVELVYSNNPMTSDTGTSTSKRVTDHVFRLNVTKVEKGKQEQKLEATFQVKMTKEGDISLKDDKWLTEDGGLTGDEKSAGKFKTAKDSGQVYIPGLVEGTYEITECDTPAGYNTLAPFTITVNPTYDNNGNLTNLDVTSSDTVMVTSENTKDATIPVTIQNKKGSGLPLTGLNGVTFTWIAGGAVLCIGVVHLIRSRKQAEESEQE